VPPDKILTRQPLDFSQVRLFIHSFCAVEN
jgi:hypothetical protein